MAVPQNYSFQTLADHIDHDFGFSKPILVNQDRINLFADATEDRQWIHVDTEKAADSPFGGTIAHGFLTLSLLASSVQESGIIPSDAKAVLNYGLDKVRFLKPVLSGRNVQASFVLVGIEDKDDTRKLIRLKATLIDTETEKTAVAAELIAMVIG